MFKNYFKTAFKSFSKQKVNSTINIIGLALGLACGILVYLYISNEISYDKFHKNGDSVYSVVRNIRTHNILSRNTKYFIKNILEESFPEIKTCVRLSSRLDMLVRHNQTVFSEKPLFADPEFFDLFSFKILKGDRRTMLQSLSSAVLTQSFAEKYFGKSDPLGKTLTISFDNLQKDFTVTGLVEDVPENSSIKFKILLNCERMKFYNEDRFNTFSSFEPYILLEKDISPSEVEKRFPAFIKTHFSDVTARIRDRGRVPEDGIYLSFQLQNIRDMHHNTKIYGIPETNDSKNSYMLAGIALLILIVAIVNYINLFIGSSSTRLVEIGVRKILGADRKQMIYQFISESIFASGIALAAGIIIAYLLMPLFCELLNKQLDFFKLFSIRNIPVLLLITIFTGIVSGSFPALILANFKPSEIFRKKLKFGRKNALTKSLIILQFSISIFLIISTFTMGKQIKYMMNQELGFDSENQIFIRLYENNGAAGTALVNRFGNKVRSNASIKNVAGSGSGPFNSYSHGLGRTISCDRVDHNYINTIGLEIVEGRDFSREISTDTLAAIVNQKFVKVQELENPVGHVYETGIYGRIGLKIIGVIKDYNFLTLDREIPPMLIHINDRMPLKYILVKISGENVSGTISFLEKTWNEVCPGKPFSYSFKDESIGNAYGKFNRWNSIINFASIFTIIITCIGMFCLTSLTVSRRFREIGIRKVLGAKISQIYNLLVKDFILLVFTADIIAIPLTYYIMNNWLQTFAYKTNLDITTFVSAIALSIIITLLTISYLVIKSALANPVDSLRDN